MKQPKHSEPRKELFQPRSAGFTTEQQRELKRIEAHARSLEGVARRNWLRPAAPGWLRRY